MISFYNAAECLPSHTRTPEENLKVSPALDGVRKLVQRLDLLLDVADEERPAEQAARRETEEEAQQHLDPSARGADSEEAVDPGERREVQRLVARVRQGRGGGRREIRRRRPCRQAAPTGAADEV